MYTNFKPISDFLAHSGYVKDNGVASGCSMLAHLDFAFSFVRNHSLIQIKKGCKFVSLTSACRVFIFSSSSCRRDKTALKFGALNDR